MGFPKLRGEGRSGGLRSAPAMGQRLAHLEIAEYIRAETEQGRELVKFLLAVARGTEPNMASEKSRRWAIDSLLNRVYGRPPQMVTLTTEPDLPPISDRDLTEEDLLVLAKLDASIPRLSLVPITVSSTPMAVAPPEGSGDDAGRES